MSKYTSEEEKEKSEEITEEEEAEEEAGSGNMVLHIRRTLEKVEQEIKRSTKSKALLKEALQVTQ